MPRHLEFHVSHKVQLHSINKIKLITLHYVSSNCKLNQWHRIWLGYKCFVYPIFKYNSKYKIRQKKNYITTLYNVCHQDHLAWTCQTVQHFALYKSNCNEWNLNFQLKTISIGIRLNNFKYIFFWIVTCWPDTLRISAISFRVQLKIFAESLHNQFLENGLLSWILLTVFCHGYHNLYTFRILWITVHKTVNNARIFQLNLYSSTSYKNASYNSIEWNRKLNL